MLVFVFGLMTIGLGVKAFSEQGIPLTKTTNLTGGVAKAIGVVVILMGLAIAAYGGLGVLIRLMNPR